MLARAADYATLYRDFSWSIPADYSLGIDLCDRQCADPDRIGLILLDEDDRPRPFRFTELRALSNRLINLLIARGLRPGDRVAILLPQSLEGAVAHLAALRLGCITMPLSTLFGPDALVYRLGDSGAAILITDPENAEKLAAIRDRLPALHSLIVTGAGPAPAGGLAWDDEIPRASDQFQPAVLDAETPALMIYTSGTTGPPKGCLHAQRVLPGHLPGVELPQEFFPQPGDLFWTPADWAWIGGLLNVLFASWHHGVPVLAHRLRKFDPERVLALMARHGVRNSFLPPLALRLLRGAAIPPGLRLRSIGSGGEALGPDLVAWAREALGVTPNEFYGQTECNLVLANCAGLNSARPGSLGRAVPGHAVAIIDDAGMPLPDGSIGNIGVHRGIGRPDPVMFLGYWNNPAATAAKFTGDYLRTGDLGRRDADGFFWFQGRDDDLINSAGYRIGPMEVEHSLEQHPAVAEAAAIAAPDPERGEIVMAFLRLNPGHAAGPELASDIQAFVRNRLAAHEYPRRIEFVAELPRTTTGKLQRSVLRAQERAKFGISAG